MALKAGVCGTDVKWVGRRGVNSYSRYVTTKPGLTLKMHYNKAGVTPRPAKVAIHVLGSVSTMVGVTIHRPQMATQSKYVLFF